MNKYVCWWVVLPDNRDVFIPGKMRTERSAKAAARKKLKVKRLPAESFMIKETDEETVYYG